MGGRTVNGRTWAAPAPAAATSPMASRMSSVRVEYLATMRTGRAREGNIPEELGQGYGGQLIFLDGRLVLRVSLFGV